MNKPAIVIDYNKAKGAVDLADQMAAYQTPLRKTVKWYKKLAFDLMLNVAMVNALILYRSVTNKSIPVVDFRKEILKSFMSKPNSIPRAPTGRTTRRKHFKKRRTLFEGASFLCRMLQEKCVYIWASNGEKQD